MFWKIGALHAASQMPRHPHLNLTKTKQTKQEKETHEQEIRLVDPEYCHGWDVTCYKPDTCYTTLRLTVYLVYYYYKTPIILSFFYLDHSLLYNPTMVYPLMFS